MILEERSCCWSIQVERVLDITIELGDSSPTNGLSDDLSLGPKSVDKGVQLKDKRKDKEGEPEAWVD